MMDGDDELSGGVKGSGCDGAGRRRRVRESATGRNRAQKGAEGSLVALQTL